MTDKTKAKIESLRPILANKSNWSIKEYHVFKSGCAAGATPWAEQCEKLVELLQWAQSEGCYNEATPELVQHMRKALADFEKFLEEK